MAALNFSFAIVTPVLPLAAVLTFAALSDLRDRRIPNPIVLAGWVSAITWHAVAAPGDWTFDSEAPGSQGALHAILGASALLGAFIPLYLLRVMGAGDVKLISVVGAFFGGGPNAWNYLLGVSLVILATGGVLALVRIIVRGTGAAVLNNLRLIFFDFSGRFGGTDGPTFDPRDSADRMPYAIAIAAGTCIYLIGKWTGWITAI